MRSSGVPPRTASTHEADRGAHLVVGVGGGDDRVVVGGTAGAGRRRAAPSPAAATPRRASERRTPWSASARPVRPATTVAGRPRRQRGEERGLAPEQVLGQVDDDGAELGRQPGRRRVADGVDGRVGEVGLVVPAVGQQRAGPAAQPHHVVRPPPGPRQRGQRRRARGRTARRTWPRAPARWRGGSATGANMPGSSAQHPPQGGGDDGGRDRAAPGGGERARAPSSSASR